MKLFYFISVFHCTSYNTGSPSFIRPSPSFSRNFTCRQSHTYIVTQRLQAQIPSQLVKRNDNAIDYTIAKHLPCHIRYTRLLYPHALSCKIKHYPLALGSHGSLSRPLAPRARHEIHLFAHVTRNTSSESWRARADLAIQWISSSADVRDSASLVLCPARAASTVWLLPVRRIYGGQTFAWTELKS